MPGYDIIVNKQWPSDNNQNGENNKMSLGNNISFFTETEKIYTGTTCRQAACDQTDRVKMGI